MQTRTILNILPDPVWQKKYLLFSWTSQIVSSIFNNFKVRERSWFKRVYVAVVSGLTHAGSQPFTPRGN